MITKNILVYEEEGKPPLHLIEDDSKEKIACVLPNGERVSLSLNAVLLVTKYLEMSKELAHELRDKCRGKILFDVRSLD